MPSIFDRVKHNTILLITISQERNYRNLVSNIGFFLINSKQQLSQ